jgi:predicted phage tail protein
VIVNDSGSSLTFQLDIGEGGVETNSLSISGTVKTSGGATRTHGASTVGVAASQLIAQNNDRTGWLVTNNGTATIYIGSDNTVTTANGTPVLAGATIGGDDTDEVWAISGTAGQDARHWEVD